MQCHVVYVHFSSPTSCTRQFTRAFIAQVAQRIRPLQDGRETAGLLSLLPKHSSFAQAQELVSQAKQIMDNIAHPLSQKIQGTDWCLVCTTVRKTRQWTGLKTLTTSLSKDLNPIVLPLCAIPLQEGMLSAVYKRAFHFPNICLIWAFCWSVKFLGKSMSKWMRRSPRAPGCFEIGIPSPFTTCTKSSYSRTSIVETSCGILHSKAEQSLAKPFGYGDPKETPLIWWNQIQNERRWLVQTSRWPLTDRDSIPWWLKAGFTEQILIAHCYGLSCFLSGR